MPSAEETDMMALDFATKNIAQPKGQQVAQKLGLGPQDIQALQFAESNPQDERSPQIRAKVMDKIAQTRPAIQEQGVPATTRALLKNVIGREPQLQVQELEKQGFQTRIVDDQIQLKKPGEIRFKVIDPKGFDLQDVTDIGVDVLEAGVTGIATGAKALGLVGAPVTGGGSVAAGSAFGGASTAGFEAARQGVGKLLGLRDEIDKSEIVTAGAIGAGVPFIFQGGAELLKKIGRGLVSLFPESQAAPAIKDAAKELGTKVTPGQLSGSKGVKKAEALLAKDDFNVGGFFLRRQRAANEEILQETAESLTAGASGRDLAQIGRSVKDKLSQAVKKRIEPAEAIYEKYETVFRRKAFTPDIEAIKNNVDELKDAFKLSESASNALSRVEKALPDVNNLTDLKKLRTQVGKAMQTDFQAKPALGPLYGSLTKARSDTLKQLAAERGGDFFDIALKEIEHADQIYRSAADDIASVLGGKTKGGLSTAVDSFAARVKDGNVVSNLFDFKDPTKVKKLAESFPEAFSDLQEGALNELVRKVTDPATDLISPRRLGNEIEKLENVSKEAVNILLGQDASKKAQALRTFIKSIPDTRQFNSSDTAQFLRTAFSISGVQQPFAAWRSLVLNSSQALRALGRQAEDAGRAFQLPASRGIGIAGSTNLIPSDQGFELPRSR